MDEGELNGETVNGKSVTQTKYGCLEITCPASNWMAKPWMTNPWLRQSTDDWSLLIHHLIKTLWLHRQIQTLWTMLSEWRRRPNVQWWTQWIQSCRKRKRERETIQQKMPKKACVGSHKPNTNKTVAITHNNWKHFGLQPKTDCCQPKCSSYKINSLEIQPSCCGNCSWHHLWN